MPDPPLAGATSLSFRYDEFTNKANAFTSNVILVDSTDSSSAGMSRRSMVRSISAADLAGAGSTPGASRTAAASRVPHQTQSSYSSLRKSHDLCAVTRNVDLCAVTRNVDLCVVTRNVDLCASSRNIELH